MAPPSAPSLFDGVNVPQASNPIQCTKLYIPKYYKHLKEATSENTFAEVFEKLACTMYIK